MGENDPTYQRDGAPKMVQNFLIARRLVEAGARVVSMNYSRWDWHGGDGLNFPRTRQEAPLLDRALTALLTDLDERGLSDDVSVVVWGEFGRTPKINKMNSRDHWPQVSFALMAGGGMSTGQSYRRNESLWRICNRAPRHIPGSFRNPLSQSRHRYANGDRRRPSWSPAIPA